MSSPLEPSKAQQLLPFGISGFRLKIPPPPPLECSVVLLQGLEAPSLVHWLPTRSVSPHRSFPPR